MLQAEKDAVAAAAQRLASEGLVLGAAGNVSARCESLVAVTPTGAVLERTGATDIVVVDLDGSPVEGDRPATSELALHLGAYRRFGAGAVVHSHSPMATALACVLDELPVVHYQMIALGGAIRVASYATFGTPELAELTLDALEGRSAALMANHGAVAIGPDVATAVENARLLEWAAGVYWRAASIGGVGRVRVLTPEQIADFRRIVAERGYAPLQGAPR